jgi:hypothetical protein
LSTDVGAGGRVLCNGSARGGIVGIEDAGLYSGARLDCDYGAETDHLFDGFRRRSDARFVRIDFGNNRDFHDSSDTCPRGRPVSRRYVTD